MHRAAYYGHNAVVQYLAEHGVPFDQPTRQGMLSIQLAASYVTFENEEDYEAMLELFHAHVGVVTLQGDSLVHLAANRNQDCDSFVCTLVGMGARYDGRAFKIAVARGNYGIALTLHALHIQGYTPSEEQIARLTEQYFERNGECFEEFR